jgi:hypothetical protein
MGAQKFSLPLDAEFTAGLEKDGPFATYLTVPGSAELLGTRRAVKVSGTVDGYPFDAVWERAALVAVASRPLQGDREEPGRRPGQGAPSAEAQLDSSTGTRPDRQTAAELFQLRSCRIWDWTKPRATSPRLNRRQGGIRVGVP